MLSSFPVHSKHMYCRSYVFLRDSGNSDVLLHYVTTEGLSNTTSVLNVLQDFIAEKHAM